MNFYTVKRVSHVTGIAEFNIRHSIKIGLLKAKKNKRQYFLEEDSIVDFLLSRNNLPECTSCNNILRLEYNWGPRRRSKNYFVCMDCDPKAFCLRKAPKQKYCSQCDDLLVLEKNCSKNSLSSVGLICFTCKQKKDNLNPINRLYYAAKQRAKKENIPFSIEKRDIILPSHCPVLGIKLENNIGRAKDNSYSLDKNIPELGYVKGNITVISFKANTIKSNATFEEMILLGKWAKKMISQRAT